ncbi:MAG TPA: RuBisCO large subunit C-terminal-like domain-containing protein [Candidatus Lokiarchaeia archaeon]|nr:RuBisCO large subunit C-terminal-like domain-containing protein [Candidatus Lokiarchaeia archaeon]
MENMENEMETWAEALYDGIDIDKYIVCTYICCLPWDYENQFANIAKVLAEEQSIGTWTHVPGETPEVRRRFIGKVLQCIELPQFEVQRPDRKQKEEFYHEQLTPYLMTIGFPIELFNDDNFSLYLTSIYGNASMLGPIRLVSVRFGTEIMRRFKGPTFGVEGIYEKLNIPLATPWDPENPETPCTRPVTINMIKPKSGYTKEFGQKLFWEAAIGGVDIIKDDEMIANEPQMGNALEERVPMYMEMRDKKFAETGEETIYTVNITDRMDRMMEMYDRVVELGGNGVMFNYINCGWSCVKPLTDRGKLVVLGHTDGAGAYYVSPLTGISSDLVMGIFPRMLGIDIPLVPAPYGKAPYIVDRYLQLCKAITMPLGPSDHRLKPGLVFPSGGIQTQHIPQLVKDLGMNIGIGTGGGIHAHPMGSIAGAKAFRQAYQACVEGEYDLKKYAKEKDLPELQASLGMMEQAHEGLKKMMKDKK